MRLTIIVNAIISLIVAGVVYYFSYDLIGNDSFNMMSIFGVVAILVLTNLVASKYFNQMQNDKAQGDLIDYKWDDIKEYKNEVPFGWSLSFIGTIVFSIWYFLVGFPLNAFSQIGEYNEGVKAFNERFNKKFSDISKSELKEMGQTVYLEKCEKCHGLEADGINGTAANLTQRIDAKSVKYVLENGSNYLGYPAPMPKAEDLGLQNTFFNEVSNYVANGFKGENKQYDDICAPCHSSKGEGMASVAPPLNAFKPNFIVRVLENGKKGAIGHMPSFNVEKNILTSVQQKALGFYIASLKE